MAKITGAMLKAIKRSKLSEAEILAALAPKDEPVEDAPAPRRARGSYNRRDMTANA